MRKKFAIVSALSIGLLAMSAPAFAATPSVHAPKGYTVSTFAKGGAATNPDDIAMLGNHIFIGYQNGIGPKGEASPKGVKASTIVEYDLNGKTTHKWNVVGKVDGLGADPSHNRIIATVNEDANSSLYTINAKNNQVTHYTYNPVPSSKAAKGALATGGGTDAVNVQNGNIYISASNPSTVKAAALFRATLNDKNHTATLSTVFTDSAIVKDAVTGKYVKLGLTDPDSNELVPSVSPKFAGDFMLDSQGDKELIFVKNMGRKNSSITRLSIAASIDDTAWATSKSGELLVSDTNTNTVYAIKGNFTKGEAFVSEGTTIGILNLANGHIQNFATGLTSPHGLIFIAK